VRQSRAVGLPSPAPDIFGLAVRVPTEGGRHGDLLFATTGLGRITRFTLGKLKFQLTELAAIPLRSSSKRATRGSSRSTTSGPASWPNGIAACQIRFPTVPLVLCETRKLAQEWTYLLPRGCPGRALGGDDRRPRRTRPRPDPRSGDGSVPRSPRSRRDLKMQLFATVGARRHEGSEWARFDSQTPSAACWRPQTCRAASLQVRGQLRP
jgi:hypothetical protein